MGLLDGGAEGIFADLFREMYLPGDLIKVARTEDAGGSFTDTETRIRVRVQRDVVTEGMRANGWSEDDARFLVLKDGLKFFPVSDDKLFAYGETWLVASVTSDPAGAYWDLRCRVDR